MIGITKMTVTTDIIQTTGLPLDAVNKELGSPQPGEISAIHDDTGKLIAQTGHADTAVDALGRAIAQGKLDRLPPDHTGRCYLRNGKTEITQFHVDYLEAEIIDAAIALEKE